MGMYPSGKCDNDIWNDLDSLLWNNMTVKNNRLPSGYTAKYAVVDKTAYVYISFYEIDKTKFGSGLDYWALFSTSEVANLPIPVRTTPFVVCDNHNVFLSSSVRFISSSVAQIEVVGNAQDYDNGKGVNYPTIIQGQYQIS